MKNLFDKKPATTKTKRDDKRTVAIPDLNATLSRLVEVDSALAELKAERAALDATIKDESLDAMVELYDSTGKFPGTLVINTGGAEVLFITADRYKKIDEDSADALVEKYGTDIVTEDVTYAFNTDVLMRNMDVINELIVKSKKISEADKENLIDKVVNYSVAKGTISNLKDYADDIHEVIDDISPVLSLKNPKVLETTAPLSELKEVAKKTTRKRKTIARKKTTKKKVKK